MPTVILVLGLVAAGIYTGNGWFYVIAAIAGFITLIIQFLLAGIIASASNKLKDDKTKRKF